MTPRNRSRAAAAPAKPAKYKTPTPKDGASNTVEFVREVVNPTTGKRQAEFMERSADGRDVLLHIVAEGAK